MTTEAPKMTKVIDGNTLPAYSKVTIIQSGATDGQPQYFKYF